MGLGMNCERIYMLKNALRMIWDTVGTCLGEREERLQRSRVKGYATGDQDSCMLPSLNRIISVFLTLEDNNVVLSGANCIKDLLILVCVDYYVNCGLRCSILALKPDSHRILRLLNISSVIRHLRHGYVCKKWLNSFILTSQSLGSFPTRSF